MQVPPGKKPQLLIPVFNYHQGHLAINCLAHWPSAT
jgi:hypothetical protein